MDCTSFLSRQEWTVHIISDRENLVWPDMPHILDFTLGQFLNFLP